MKHIVMDHVTDPDSGLLIDAGLIEVDDENDDNDENDEIVNPDADAG